VPNQGKANHHRD
jgi:hypothetical protein